MKNKLIFLIIVLIFSSLISAFETPFTARRDGFATINDGYDGYSKYLEIKANEKRAWVDHLLEEIIIESIASARLVVYVKDVIHGGTLNIYPYQSITKPENHVDFYDLAPDTSNLYGSAIIPNDNLKEIAVSIPLSKAFIDSIETYNGLSLVGTDGLEIDLGALEASRGIILYIEYAITDKDMNKMVSSVVTSLLDEHKDEIKGEAGAGLEIKGSGTEDAMKSSDLPKHSVWLVEGNPGVLWYNNGTSWVMMGPISAASSESDPIFSTSAAKGIAESDVTKWNSTYSDLIGLNSTVTQNSSAISSNSLKVGFPGFGTVEDKAAKGDHGHDNYLQAIPDSVISDLQEVRGRFSGYTGNLQLASIEDFTIRLDTDSSDTSSFSVLSSTGDSLFRVSEDSSARFYGDLTVDGVLSFKSNMTVTGNLTGDQIVATSANISGNLDVAGAVNLQDSLYVSTNAVVSGKLGIGTNNPSYKLQIGSNKHDAPIDEEGDIYVSGNPGRLFLYNNKAYDDTSGGQQTGIIYFGSRYNKENISTGGPFIKGERSDSSSGYFGYDLLFGVRKNGETSSEAMRIDENGSVGIGTRNPQRKLHIYESATAYLKLENANCTNGGTDIYQDNNYFAIRNRENGSIRLYTNNEPRMYIQPDGKVGIGTTDPKEILHVAGGNLLLDNNQWLGFITSGGASANVLTVNSSNDLRLTAPAGGSVRMAANSGADHLIIDVNGNVGIGTSTILHKLSVDGNILAGDAMKALILDDGTNAIYSTASSAAGLGLSIDGQTTPSLFISTDGNVGVGTINPSKTLEVNGEMKSTRFGEAFNYTECQGQRVKLIATRQLISTDAGPCGVYYISTESRAETGTGSTGGAVGILIVSKQYGGNYTLNWTQIASAGGINIALNTVTNLADHAEESLKLEFTTSNLDPFCENWSVIEMGNIRYRLTWDSSLY
ncbi:MAG: hypothetical protein HQK83_08065 [Fibrobacteria bacterium]|nr:hypothetical protein [Fibrobacteria bacterium]